MRAMRAPSRAPATRFTQRQHRTDAGFFTFEQVEPVAQRLRLEQRGELGQLGLELARLEVGPAEQVAQPQPELRLERGDGEVAAVGGFVDAVAGGAAGEQARRRVAGEPVRHEAMGGVGHRHDDALRAAFDQRGEDLDHRHLPARGEVGDLHGRHRRRRIGEHARVAEVVQVVPRLSAVRAEAGDRADDRVGSRLHVEPLEHPGAKALEDDARLRESLVARVPVDDLLALVQRCVPAWRRGFHRVAAARLDLHDARAKPLQLAAREGAGEISREVGDRDAGESGHARDYARRTNDRRRDLVRAAIRVFARKGFHAARVGDIAEEAGVAHGLLYHYFRSKEDVLETIFRETWTTVVAETSKIESSGEPFVEQLRAFASFYLGTWLVAERVGVLRDALAALRRMIEQAQARGEVRDDADPQLATWAFYGALEELLGGWVLGQLPSEADDVDRAVSTVVEVFSVGFAA